MARATSEAGDVPGIEFVAEAERCPVCDGALKVYKSRSRQVITLAAGAFRAIETLKQCEEDSRHPVMGANALVGQVVPRQRYGYDLIVHVGCGEGTLTETAEFLAAHSIRVVAARVESARG